MPPKTKPSTPSPKPEPAAEPDKGLTQKGTPRKRAPGAGRPAGDGYHPTEEQRTLVTVMAAMGIPEVQMVLAVLNPDTKRPISPVTLRKHFREELDRGITQANTKVIAALFKNATTATDTYPGGIPSSQIFWAKCRLRWQQSPHLAPPPPLPEAEERDPKDVARRMAFLLAKGAHEAEKARAPKQLPGPKKKLKTAA